MRERAYAICNDQKLPLDTRQLAFVLAGGFTSLHNHITSLESQFAAIGAGGVEPLRKRACLHQIAEPAGERTAKDYAIEHAEYMAQDAERMLSAINALNAQRDEDGDAFDESALEQAQQSVSEAFGAMRSGIYEFRKRRDRAMQAQAAPGAGNWVNAADVDRLVRELDVALNGEHGAAQQPSLCDVVGQVKTETAKLGRPLLAAPAGFVPVAAFDRLQALADSQAARILALEAAAVPSDASITLDFKQATELLEMFGGEPGLVTLQRGSDRSHSGSGLYAWYSDMPEEGAGFLGEPDDEAAPQPPVAAHEPVASVYTMEALVPGAHPKCHVNLHKPLPAGTKLYTHPAPQPAQGDALTEIVGCLDAANAEGLDDALVNNTDARLADLVQRRLLPAFYVAIAAQAREGGK